VNLVYCLLILLLVGCSSHKQEVDASLLQYIEQFSREASIRGVSPSFAELEVKFGALNADTYGRCDVNHDSKTIIINEVKFNALDIMGREQLLFHELAHCVLGLKHDDATEGLYNPNTNSVYILVPSSIMNRFHFSSNVYSPNRSIYIDRLFGIDSTDKLYWGQSNSNNFIYQKEIK